MVWFNSPLWILFMNVRQNHSVLLCGKDELEMKDGKQVVNPWIVGPAGIGRSLQSRYLE